MYSETDCVVQAGAPDTLRLFGAEGTYGVFPMATTAQVGEGAYAVLPPATTAQFENHLKSLSPRHYDI